MIDKTDMPATFKNLAANATEIAAWTEALEQVGGWDSPAAGAIRKHLETLADNQARIMGLPEDEIARINAEADAAVEREIEQSVAVTRRAIEADLSPAKVSEIKRYIDDLRHG